MPDQMCIRDSVEADTPEKIHLALDKIHAKGKKAGIVLKPNTRAEAVLPFLDKCDICLLYTSRLPEHSSMRRAQQCRIPHAVCRRGNVTRASR